MKVKTKKKAFITGVMGQDGSYLAEFLLGKDYEVHGLVRRTSIPNTKNIKTLLQDPSVFNKKFFLHEGDMADAGSLMKIIKETQPDEVYNFAGMSGVGPSFFQPEYTIDIGAMGMLRLLEALRMLKKDARFFQAGSSHIFGNTSASPQNENTRFQPISPYAVAKATGEHLVKMYRDAYGIFACSAIFYTHASPRYSEGFLLSKIVHSIWRILAGEQEIMELGNLDVPMDIGYAKEYVRAAYNIMQQPKADDFIISTGEAHTSREFLDAALEMAGLKFNKVVKINENLRRPSEVSALIGDHSKARKAFGFKPKVKFKELIALMINDRGK